MAVEETTTTTHLEDNSKSDLLRKIAAAIVGIIVIILIVLAAKWIGDRVRERFFPGTLTPTPVVTITPVPSGYITLSPSQLPTNVPTYSHSPSTGPEDYTYIIVGLAALTGFSFLTLAKRK